jgi:hypothetical protein
VNTASSVLSSHPDILYQRQTYSHQNTYLTNATLNRDPHTALIREVTVCPLLHLDILHNKPTTKQLLWTNATASEILKLLSTIVVTSSSSFLHLDIPYQCQTYFPPKHLTNAIASRDPDTALSPQPVPPHA